MAAERQLRQVLEQELSGVAAFNLGLVLLAQRRVDAAMAAYGRAIVEYGADETLRMEVAQDLRELVARNGGLGAGILRRYWAEE